MGKTADFFADEDVPRARVALLLEHFSRLEDDREPWRIVYPLSEVLLLLTCATIASCDDFDEIAAWGKHHLDLLRKFAPYYNGIPCERWLRALVNRIDPQTFASCFEDWIHSAHPHRHRRQDLAPHPRQAKGPQSAAHSQRLRDQRPSDVGANQRAREDQRDNGHPRPARSSGGEGTTRRRPRHHRRHWVSGRDRRQDRRTQGRFSAALEGQSADPGSRSRSLLRNRAGGGTRLQNHGRERPRPHRDPRLYRLESRRLDRERQILSGSTTFQRHPYDSSRTQSNRIR